MTAEGDLFQQLDLLFETLERHGFGSSIDRLRDYTVRLRAGDGSVVEPLRLLFPGMGGPGDLYLDELNGEPLTNDEWNRVNSDYLRLIDSIYRLLEAVAASS